MAQLSDKDEKRPGDNLNLLNEKRVQIGFTHWKYFKYNQKL